ncbi:lysine ketoglutarate reductase trans-splicing protein [Trifolium repens]|nr:lysine ketoglutarate reductase trans-splicing protein [Trifolium repens]
MGTPTRSGNIIKTNEVMKLIVSSIVGVVFGFFVGVSFPTLSLTKMNLPSSLFPSIDLTYVEDKYSKMQANSIWDAWDSLRGGDRNLFNELHKFNEDAKIWVPSNPRGAERLPPRIIESESDFYLRRLWGLPHQDLSIKPRYLITFTVGYEQSDNIDAAIKKFSENFTIVLFHYDGRVSEWNKFEWSKKAIHISARKQSKWWFAKRFLHPDIVAPYDYIFIWDEDLGMEHFDAEEYLKIVKKHGLEISQPGLDRSSDFTWEMTRKNDGGGEVHREAEEKDGWCSNPPRPPCAAFVEIMAPVFTRDAWRCVWYMIQNDLIHGWGIDFALRKCVEEPAHEKIGVVDTQWVIHQSVPSLGNQGQEEDGKEPWEGVRERCHREWSMFKERMANAEKDYFQAAN